METVANILAVTSILLAAFFKAVADTLSFHFEKSIFKWKDKRFWFPPVSSEYTPLFQFWFIRTKYRPDAWHLANSGMIVSFCLAGIFFSRSDQHLPWYWELGIAGVLFIACFNSFYDKILYRP